MRISTFCLEYFNKLYMTLESFYKFQLCIILKVQMAPNVEDCDEDLRYCCALEKDSGEGTVSSCYCFLCENRPKFISASISKQG